MSDNQMVPRGARAVREVGAGLLPERGDAGADKHGFIAVFGGGWVHRSKGYRNALDDIEEEERESEEEEKREKEKREKEKDVIGEEESPMMDQTMSRSVSMEKTNGTSANSSSNNNSNTTNVNGNNSNTNSNSSANNTNNNYDK